MQLKQPEACFEEIYQIYQEAFPNVERRTKEGQRAVLENPRYRLRVIQEGNGKEDGGRESEDRDGDGKKDFGQIIAFLGYWELDSCIFLEHLATTALCRGKGYGRQLIQECLGEGKAKGKPLFLEIEPVTAENPITGRRESFYHRCGFATNHFFYQQMPLKESDRPILLWIMSWPEAVSEERFLPFKKEIYQEVYGLSLGDFL